MIDAKVSSIKEIKKEVADNRYHKREFGY